jgi:hypothetical protein
VVAKVVLQVVVVEVDVLYAVIKVLREFLTKVDQVVVYVVVVSFEVA